MYADDVRLDQPVVAKVAVGKRAAEPCHDQLVELLVLLAPFTVVGVETRLLQQRVYIFVGAVVVIRCARRVELANDPVLGVRLVLKPAGVDHLVLLGSPPLALRREIHCFDLDVDI